MGLGGRNVKGEEGCACVCGGDWEGVGSKWELSVLSARFCCEPKTAQKIKLIFKKRKKLETESLPSGSKVTPEGGHMRTAPSAESERSIH